MLDSLLTETQRHFRAAVLDGKTAPAAALLRAPGPVGERIDIYRNTVQSSLADVLATAFPAVRRIVGAECFAGLAQGFIAAKPPRRPQLSTYGSEFAAFIATTNLNTQLPYLSDVARLEWARGEAYFAADAPLLDLTRIGAMSPREMDDATLILHPAVRLIRSRYPIYRIWDVNQPENDDIPQIDMSQPQDALVSRPSFSVTTRTITPADAAFITAIQSGAALSAAANEALKMDAGFDLQAALTQHFLNGTFAESSF